MKRNLLTLGLMAVCFVMAASVASAAACAVGNTIFSTTTGETGTILSGISSPAESNCTLGGFDFANWQLVMASGFGSTPTSSFNLSFGPGTGVSGGGVTLDFAFTSLSAGQDIRLFYSITPGVTNMTLNTGGTGNANIGETICSVSNATSNVCPMGDVLATLNASANTSSSSTVIFAAEDFVGKDISAGSSGSISEFSQQIVPEPMTLTMLGAGLLGLGALGRRRLRK